MRISTSRLELRPWAERDREPFAALHMDPRVMSDLGGPIGRPDSDAKLERYKACFDQFGFGRWAVENKRGEFLGYVGAMPSAPEHPAGTHVEIGWRLIREGWGHGYATEAARAALVDLFTRVRLTEVIAYTSAGNAKSTAVMTRLQLRRDPSRDFVATYAGLGAWRGLVWIADGQTWLDKPSSEVSRTI